MNLRGKTRLALSGAVCGLLFFVQLAAGQTTAKEFEKLGYEQSKAGKYDEAVRLYSECLRLEPKNAFCLTQRAWIYFIWLKKYEPAIADYSELISLLPETKSYLYFLTQYRCNRGFAYEQIGNLDAAFKDYSEALRLSPDDSKSLFGLVSVSFKKGNHKLSSEQVNRSLDTIRGPQWYVLRGKIQKALNNKTAAEGGFQRGFETRPEQSGSASRACRLERTTRQSLISTIFG